jgi:TonB family protein
MQKAAIKLIPADVADAEATVANWDAIASLSHPHLMSLIRTGHCQVGDEAQLYAVTEYADENLAQVLPERALTAAEAREMLGPILDALAYLHGKGLVHCHLKPSNIMVVNDQLKLSVDGISLAGQICAKNPEPDIHDAPESDGGRITPAADVWALGVTLVEALTQQPPVWKPYTLREPIVPSSMPQPFATIARACLQRDPARRCTLAKIRALLEPTELQPEAVDRRLPDKLRWAIAGAAAVLLIAIALLVLRSHPSAPLLSAAEEQNVAAPAPAATNQAATSEPAAMVTVAPAAQKAGGATGKGAVDEKVLPDVSQQAQGTIHGSFMVSVRVTVDMAGKVSEAEFESPGPSRYFANLALQAARKWRFTPARIGGRATTSSWLLHFQFGASGSQVTAVEETP